jgi:MscS family membrane protein
MPKVFQTVAVMLFVIKAAETFLGASAGALIGLLGGAGVAMGLLFKDIIYDWCCAVIIYTDGIYRPGDWVAVDGISGFIQIKEIGLRSTSLWSLDWGSPQKIPNSHMISGVVENWSQDRGEKLEWGLFSKVKVDGISAEQTDRILDSMEVLVDSLESSSKNLITFDGMEGNARVISIKVYVNDANLYVSNQRTLHLGILEILENEGINHMNVFIRTDPFKLDKTEKAVNN